MFYILYFFHIYVLYFIFLIRGGGIGDQSQPVRPRVCPRRFDPRFPQLWVPRTAHASDLPLHAGCVLQKWHGASRHFQPSPFGIVPSLDPFETNLLKNPGGHRTGLEKLGPQKEALPGPVFLKCDIVRGACAWRDAARQTCLLRSSRVHGVQGSL